MTKTLKIRKNLITAISVLLALAAIALAVIFGTAAGSVDSEAAIKGEAAYSGSNASQDYKDAKAAISSANANNIGTCITQYVLNGMSPIENRYIKNAYTARAKELEKSNDSGVKATQTLIDKWYFYDEMWNSGSFLQGTLDRTTVKSWFEDDNKKSGISYDSATNTYTIAHNVGDGNYWRGVSKDGCTVKEGVKLIFYCDSDFFNFYGRLTIDGGEVAINISSNRLEKATAKTTGYTGTELKRGIVKSLRDTSTNLIKGTISSTGYTAAKDTNINYSQYHGPLFVVNSGKLTIKGAAVNEEKGWDANQVDISGAGQFSFDINDTSSTTAGLKFPINNTTGDIVEAHSPVIIINDGYEKSSPSGPAPDVTLQRVNIANNYNGYTGGGAIAFAGTTGTLKMYDSKIYGCYSLVTGSAMTLNTTVGGNVEFYGVSIYNCYSPAKSVNGGNPVENTANGGTIRTYGENKANLTLSGCDIYNNWNRHSSTIVWSSLLSSTGLTIKGRTVNNEMVQTKIRHNYSYSSSPGINCMGNMTMTDTFMYLNTSDTGNGGGIAVSTWSTDKVNNDFKLTKDGSVTLGSGVCINDNKLLNGSGGGIVLICNEISIGASNGGFYLTQKADGTPYQINVVIDGAKIYNNQAKNGGGIHIRKNNFEYNRNFDVNLVMRNGEVYNNTATENGGGVLVDDARGESYDKAASFYMSGGEIYSNKAGGNGGAVYVTGGGVADISGGLISENKSARGGAMYVSAGSVNISGGTVKNNRAYLEGGAVYVTGGGNVTITGGKIQNNTAQHESDETQGRGGAIFLTGGGALLSISGADTSLLANHAGEGGGAMYVENGACIIDGGIFSQNTAGKVEEASLNSKGAVLYVSNGTVTVKSGNICDNTATGDGGFLYMNGGSVTVNDGTITSNRSVNASGGAIYVQGGSVSVQGGTFTANHAKVSGGAIAVDEGDASDCYFSMTAGTLNDNYTEQGGLGGAIYVSGASSFVIEIGVRECNCEHEIDPKHALCPQIINNRASFGGAIYVKGGTPIIYCGDIQENQAIAAERDGEPTDGSGGAIYVKNANITVYYANMIGNSAASKGGAIYVEASSFNANVIVDSGVISYNTAATGAGIAVEASGGNVATITIGREGCNGLPESEHKHPQISNNIATLKGGGLYFVSDSNNGIEFNMYCGFLGDNTANGNVPTGNILQQGGTISITGDYSIENATVINGTYLRPDLSAGMPDNLPTQITINYYYNTPGEPADKSSVSTVTVAVGSDERMFINLPSVDGSVVGPNDNPMMLVKWDLKATAGSSPIEGQSRLVGEMLVLNSDYIQSLGMTTLNFYGVWLGVGDEIHESPLVEIGMKFAHIESGHPYAYGMINNPFTVQFGVQNCNPAVFTDRNLQFNYALPEGTVVLMLYHTAEANVFYYYNIDGTETQIFLTDFLKLGDPGVTWRNTVVDETETSNERIMFIFDFSRANGEHARNMQITLERNYDEALVGEERAPLTQVVSCSMNEYYAPSISVSKQEDILLGEDVDIGYSAGVAQDENSIYNNDGSEAQNSIEASLVIYDDENKLGVDSYFVYGENRYYKNVEGVFVLPIGVAKQDGVNTLKLISPSLEASARTDEPSYGKATLRCRLYITPDGSRPLASPDFGEVTLTFKALPKPSVDITLANRVLYTDAANQKLNGDVTLTVTKTNFDGCTLELAMTKLNPSDGNYGSTTEATVATVSEEEGVITFTDATTGTFRVTATVKRGEQIISTMNYNLLVINP